MNENVQNKTNSSVLFPGFGHLSKNRSSEGRRSGCGPTIQSVKDKNHASHGADLLNISAHLVTFFKFLRRHTVKTHVDVFAGCHTGCIEAAQEAAAGAATERCETHSAAH